MNFSRPGSPCIYVPENHEPPAVVFDASALDADLASVDRLARLQLATQRRGRALRLLGVSGELRALLTLTGLAGALGVEPRGQPEEREDALDVEEERQLGDPPA
jgi:anti-anti-sigma regulatory factor